MTHLTSLVSDRPAYHEADGKTVTQQWRDYYGFIVTDSHGATVHEYVPTPKQLDFHECNAPNCILEGSRGTGKSLAIRNDAHMRAMSIPGFRYLIIRRTMPELKKTHLIFIAHEMKKLGGHFHKGDNIAFYANGSQGFFTHCETDDDVMKTLGGEYDAIYFDEITTFTWELIVKIAACARVPEGSERMAIVRGGTNPIGIGAEDVMRYYIAKDVSALDDAEYNPDDYVAIHTTLDDNPFIDQNQYRKRLSSLPEHIRRAWLDGEWVREGAYFADFRPTVNGAPFHVVERLPRVNLEGDLHHLLDLPWIHIYRAVDWGFYPDPAVCLWIAVLPNGAAVVFKERTWNSKTAKFVAQEIKRESEGLRVVQTFCDPTMFSNEEAVGSSVGTIFELNGVPLTQSKNDRAAAGYGIHEWLNELIDDYGPKLTMLKSGSPLLIKTLPSLRFDKANPAKIANGNDHWTIALAYFCMANVGPSMAPKSSSVPKWMKPKETRKILGNANVRTARG